MNLDASACEPKRMELLREIMQVQFVALELNLFLDTHPSETAALLAFGTYSEQLMKLKEIYESQFGPLLNFGWSETHGSWQWIDEPWPWEINWRRGV